MAVREFMLTQTTQGTLDALAKEADEGQMRARLQVNPNDAEAKEYFAKKERRTRVLETRNLMLQVLYFIILFIIQLPSPPPPKKG